MLAILRRGPNAAGWVCLAFFGYWSWEAGNPLPIAGFLAIAIIPSAIMIWLDSRKRND